MAHTPATSNTLFRMLRNPLSLTVMPNRTLIVSLLLPAYLLLVLHSLIPHHHHAPAHPGPVQYHHGSHVHHADDVDHESAHHDDHQDRCPSSHFVHAPDFGKAMLRSDADLILQPPIPCLPAGTTRYLLQDYNEGQSHRWVPTTDRSVDDSKGRRHLERGPPVA